MISMKRLLLLLAISISSCATIHEAEEHLGPENLINEPNIAVQLDSTQASRIKSAIQSSPTTLLSNNMMYRGGKWSLCITADEADSLGVTKHLYHSFKMKIQALNSDLESDE